MTRRRPPRPRTLWRGLVVSSLLAIGLAGCGGEEITDYRPEDRTEFLQACTIPGEDSILVTSVCGCVYDRLEATVAFERFEEISDELANAEDDTVTELDGAVVAAMASCLADRVSATEPS